MAERKLMTEFGIASYVDFLVLTVQEGLSRLQHLEGCPELPIYLICRRPKIKLLPDSFIITKNMINATFEVQLNDETTQISLDIPNSLNTDRVRLECNYPFTDLKLLSEN